MTFIFHILDNLHINENFQILENFHTLGNFYILKIFHILDFYMNSYILYMNYYIFLYQAFHILVKFHILEISISWKMSLTCHICVPCQTFNTQVLSVEENIYIVKHIIYTLTQSIKSPLSEIGSQIKTRA